MRAITALLFSVSLLPLNLSAGDIPAKEITRILNVHCHRCHGQNGAVEGGMSDIVDLSRLLQKRLIVPGKPDESPLLKRIAKGEMPPGGEEPRPSAADAKILREWIAAGAKLDKAQQPPRDVLTSAWENQAILDDLARLEPRAKKFQRYFSFVPYWNAGAGPDELLSYRNALAKLVNSLSWHPAIRNPEAVDPNGLLFRIDLRWYLWDATVWNRILQDYPYGIQTGGVRERVIASQSATRLPVIRGDWFIATASRAPLYREILKLPGNLTELERQIRVEAEQDLQQDRVLRVAFNGSGISKNNRILERHDSAFGYYWRSYDFEEVPQNLSERGNLLPDRRNVFAYPLGPGNLAEQFQHAGGEAIFRLPNGLQGYFLMNAVNNRIDKGPAAIVSDARRPDRAVELGVSCMGCHISGILPKADQMHDHLQKNAQAFKKADWEAALALYPGKEKTLAQMEADSKLFLAALAQTGTPKTRNEPIIALTQRYEGELSATQAASELGLSHEEMLSRLASLPELNRNLGGLRLPGGSIARQVWLQAFGDLVRDLGLGSIFQANKDSGRLPDNTGDVDPLENLSGTANAIAFAADGKTAFLAGGDKSIRIVEVEAQRDLKRLIGHSASIWSIALSPDEKWIASGSADRTVRLWDRGTFQEKAKFEGHEATVSAVAFDSDGALYSGGFDGQLFAWNRDKPAIPARKWNLNDPIAGLSLSKDGNWLAAAAGSKIVLIDSVSGQMMNKIEAHTGPVVALAFLPDGDLLSLGEDGSIRLWVCLSAGKLREWKTGPGLANSLAVRPDGKGFLTSGSDRQIQLWSLKEDKPIKSFGPMAEAVRQVHFASNGRQILAGDQDGHFKVWNMAKSRAIGEP